MVCVALIGPPFVTSQINSKSLNVHMVVTSPWAVPTVVSVTVWKRMYSDTGGVLNHILMSAGLTNQKIAWLSTIGTTSTASIYITTGAISRYGTALFHILPY